MKTILVSIICLVFSFAISCKSVPKEKVKTSVSVNKTDQSTVQKKITEMASVEKNKDKIIEKNTLIDENSNIDENIREYDIVETDSGYVSVLKKETIRKISNNKQQDTNKKINDSYIEKTELIISHDINSAVNKDVNINENTESLTEASPDPKRWRYIFGIILIVFISGILIYIKFFRKK